MKPRLLAPLLLALLAASSEARGGDERCFDAVGKVVEDARTIRLEALEMGWQVGKGPSETAAGVAKRKLELHPKHDVEICLREQGGLLEIRVQALSEADDRGEWRPLPGRKKRND